MLNNNEEVLTVRIGCEKHEVDAETVISLMQATVSLLQASSRTVCPKDVLRVNVSPFVPGSFEILFHLLPVGDTLLKNVPYIADTLSVVKDYLSFKKWWKQEPTSPTKIEPGIYEFDGQKIEINNVQTVNIYNNSTINNNISEAFAKVQNDDSIQEIAVYKGRDKEELLATIPHTHYDKFIEPSNSEEPEKTSERQENNFRVTVTIYTTVLPPTTKSNKWSKWKVVYNGRIISVDIRDVEFRNRVKNREYRFAGGDRIEVNLTEKKKFNAETDEYIIDGNGYIISQVYDYIPSRKTKLPQSPKPLQQKTFFDEEEKPKRKKK